MASNNLIVVLLVVMILAAGLFDITEASYKKPPFNGSIFGKRNSIEYDSNGKALTAMCEIALEACQSWFPSSQDSK